MNCRLLRWLVDINVDADRDVKGVSMTKAKTHFEQVPVEIAERAARAESSEHSTDTTRRPANNKRSNGNAVAVTEPIEEKKPLSPIVGKR